VFGHLDGQGHPLGDWMEMVDPRNTNISLDLSFALTTEEPTMDFGDAPDQPYPTLLASNGARHTVVPAIRLGPLIDAEANGQPNGAATGDDANNLPDEDGVVFNTPLIPGTVATVTVTASMGQLPLNAWVDFGLDGSWLTPGDQIFNNFILAAGPNVLTFPVPPQPMSVLGTTYARFRFSTMANLQPIGAAPNGEVEDYSCKSNRRWITAMPPTRPSRRCWPTTVRDTSSCRACKWDRQLTPNSTASQTPPRPATTSPASTTRMASPLRACSFPARTTPSR